MIIDTHTHLLDEKFSADREEVIENLARNGVCAIVENGTNITDSKKAVLLAQSHKNIYAAVGIHPHDASTATPEALKELKLLAKENKVVAIGEIGLDYHYDFSPREAQRTAFFEQIKLAKEAALPIVVHSREAAQETFDILKEENVKGEIHCFSASAQMAQEYVKRGFYIGIGGAVTFKNNKKTVEVAKAVPLEKILLETDCPYMTPEPFRGKRNEPKYTFYAAKKIAEIKNIDVEEVISQTHKNAMEFFGIK